MESYQKELASIKKVLKDNPKGMTITDVSKKINVNRNSVAKYLDVLQISGHVEMRTIGPAKVYYLSQRVPISAMLNFSTDYVVVLGRDLKIVNVNDNLLNFLNTKKEVLLGRDIEESPLPIFIDEEITPKIKAALEGKDSTMETNFQMREKEFYFRIKLIPTTFDDGGHGVTILLEDITERKRIEKTLKERIKELNCLYCISELVEKSNISLEEIIQGTVDIIPPALQYPEIACARITLKGQEYRTENFKETGWKRSSQITARGERIGTLDIYYLEDKSKNGEIHFLKEEKNLLDAIVERLRRIIELKQAEEELRISEKKFRGLFENILEGVYQTTPDGEIISVNRALVRMLGYGSEADLRDVDTVHELYVNPVKRKNLIRELEKEGELRNVELVLKHKDGHHVIALENARVVHDIRGKVLYYEGTLTDITERKRAEMELKSLFEASRLINSTTNTDKIFKFISDSVQNLVGFDNLIIFLVSEDGKSVYSRYASEGIRKKIVDTSLNYGEGLVGYCIENKEILLLENAHKDKRSKRIPELTEVFVSQIVVPLIIEDKCVGALHISKAVPNAYRQEDINVLKPLGEIISSAIRNSLLYDKLGELGVELEEKS